MKLQLVMLDNPIVVSDEEIKSNEWFYHPELKRKQVVGHDSFLTRSKQLNFKKIIAGIPELYSITYSVEASLELSKRCGWVDVEKLAEHEANKITFMTLDKRDKVIEHTYYSKGVIKGFKAAQSINEKKLLSEWNRYTQYRNFEADEYLKPLINDFIQFLSQPKVFDIEVEMEEYDEGGFSPERQLKITNNSIKITKIL